MSRVLILGDIHLSDRPPSSCTDTYLDDLFDMLDYAVECEKKFDCDATVSAGDVFHHKQPGRTSYRTMLRMIDVVRRFKRFYIVPGNHDMLNDRVDSISESQPLGVLLNAGAKLLVGWATSDPLPIYGIPWQQEWSDEAITLALEDWDSSGLIVTHAPIYPPGQELEFEYYPTRDEPDRKGLASLISQGYLYYGHIHEPHGIYKVGDVTFCNHGALSRGSLHEYNLTREVAFTIWDSEHGFIKVPVPHKPASEIFRLTEAQEVKDHSAALDAFLESISSTQIEVTSIESVMQQINMMTDLDPAVKELAVKLLQDSVR